MGGVSSFERALVWSLVVGDTYSRAAASPSRTSGGAQWWTMRARRVGLHAKAVATDIRPWHGRCWRALLLVALD